MVGVGSSLGFTATGASAGQAVKLVLLRQAMTVVPLKAEVKPELHTQAPEASTAELLGQRTCTVGSTENRTRRLIG
jgi:hypothetical protein